MHEQIVVEGDILDNLLNSWTRHLRALEEPFNE